MGFLFEGEAGIGKTTLWRHAIEHAEERSFRALSCTARARIVSVIDGSTDAVVRTIALNGTGPAWAAVNPRTNKVYVTVNGGCCASGNTVAVIDGTTDTVLRYVQVDPDPFLVAVNPQTNRVYVRTPAWT
jgi:DNA-binding beta-propeller fold protein YncE